MEFALRHLLAEELKEVLVLIELVRPYIYDKMERVRNDIMLRATLDDGYSHLRCTQQRTGLAELVVA